MEAEEIEKMIMVSDFTVPTVLRWQRNGAQAVSGMDMLTAMNWIAQDCRFLI